MRITIDGSLIRTEADFHDALAGPLEFGPYYGRNLDALWDRLSTDVERPVELIWEKSAVSRDLLGAEKFKNITSILLKVVKQDESFGWSERFTMRFE